MSAALIVVIFSVAIAAIGLAFVAARLSLKRSGDARNAADGGTAFYVADTDRHETSSYDGSDRGDSDGGGGGGGD